MMLSTYLLIFPMECRGGSSLPVDATFAVGRSQCLEEGRGL